MTKYTGPTKSMKSPLGRNKVVEFPSEPSRVSKDALAKTSPGNNTRVFDFPRQDVVRPSTSGGPSTKSSVLKTSAEERKTRDDFNFNPLKAHGGNQTTFYNFPLTPTTSPRLPQDFPVPHPTTTRTTIVTVESANAGTGSEVMGSQQAEIGMALGSPTTYGPSPSYQQQHHAFQPQSTAERFAMSPSPDIESLAENPATAPAPSKQKASRWKVFGGLFNHATKKQQAFYQVQAEAGESVPTEQGHVRFAEPAPSPDSRPKSRGRTKTVSEKKDKNARPDVTRSQTAPQNFEFPSKGKKQALPAIMLDGGPMADHFAQKQKKELWDNSHNGLMLDVDIPTNQMERYSVMFGSVLQKQPNNTPMSSSLLARRQATLDRLKTVNEALASKEEELKEREALLKNRTRRATSPQPTKSPAFSLFPSTPSHLTVRDALPSPLQRSNTSPAALSPSRPTFAVDPSPSNKDEDMSANLWEPAPHIPIEPTPRQPQEKQRNNSTPQPKPQMMRGRSASTAAIQPVPKQRLPFTKAVIKNVPPAHAVANIEVRTDWHVSESHLTMDSPVSMTEEEELQASSSRSPRAQGVVKVPSVRARPADSQKEEPQWKILNTRKQSNSTSSGSSNSDASTSGSSVSSERDGAEYKQPAHVQIQAAPPARRNRSATTTSVPRPRPEEVSNASFGSPNPQSSPPLKKPETTKAGSAVDENEARLQDAASISIARQISVSRQQRQLLIPIKTSSATGGLKPSPSSSTRPSPLTSPSGSALNINQASPLASVESPVMGAAAPTHLLNQRLLQSAAKPATPTLVVVGASGEREKMWAGATMSSRRGSPNIPRSEMSRGGREGMDRAALGGGLRMGSDGGESRAGSQVIEVGLAFGPGEREAMGHVHRKSERVVVERVH